MPVYRVAANQYNNVRVRSPFRSEVGNGAANTANGTFGHHVSAQVVRLPSGQRLTSRLVVEPPVVTPPPPTTVQVARAGMIGL